MSVEEKRQTMIRMAERSLRTLDPSGKMLAMLKTGSEREVNDWWARFFELPWLNSQRKNNC